MSKQEKQTARDLFKDLAEENPLASKKELEKLFIAASRGNADIEREMFEFFFETEYPGLAAKTKN
jgi:CRISPR/Cas system-associated protein Csm6